MSTNGKRVRVAALADLHCGKTAPAGFQGLFRHINANADIFLLCGDLTDHGQPEEGEALVRELKATITIPMLAVLGNHDCHAGKQDELERLLEGAGVRVL